MRAHAPWHVRAAGASGHALARVFRRVLGLLHRVVRLRLDHCHHVSAYEDNVGGGWHAQRVDDACASRAAQVASALQSAFAPDVSAASREQRAWRARREQRARVQGGRVGARARQRRGRSREEFPVRTFVLSSSRSQISVTLSSVDSELFQNIHNIDIRSRDTCFLQGGPLPPSRVRGCACTQ